MADKKKLELAELVGKPNHEILSLALAGECEGTIAALAIAENDKISAAKLAEAEKLKIRDVSKPALQDNGKVRYMAGKADTAFQHVRHFRAADELRKILLEQFASCKGEVTAKEVESRDFGAASDAPKVKRTVYYFGKMEVGSKAEHVEEVRQYLKSLQS